MKRLLLPEKYQPTLNAYQTQEAIKFVRDNFEKKLCKRLNLTRVSAPLFVFPSSGLNDNLNGVERRVNFDIKNVNEEVEIVQSLAKWKRYALHKYGFVPGTGLYTNMNAIRRDEDLDSMHSAYVDQWDWEKVIDRKDRTIEYLKDTVRKIYLSIKSLAHLVEVKYQIFHNLPRDVFFITTKELEQMYPSLDPNMREYEIVKKHKAVFLMQIGDALSNGKPHDGRAPDYDDWSLNGDLLVYYDVLDIAFELSSMGIRVDEKSLVSQLKKHNDLDKLTNPYCQSVVNNVLPLTIGGGIGQSRLCMFMLKKAHIGEVQASVWPREDLEILKKHNIYLL
ncbi:MAG: aspartate--ammonia ligase [Acholeplasmatales bacterium]|nr:aspartate--ammonia ligase [Acholeplasmatales bacterium]